VDAGDPLRASAEARTQGHDNFDLIMNELGGFSQDSCEYGPGGCCADCALGACGTDCNEGEDGSPCCFCAMGEPTCTCLNDDQTCNSLQAIAATLDGVISDDGLADANAGSA
jgi:hypothetical protein